MKKAQILEVNVYEQIHGTFNFCVIIFFLK